MKVLRGHLHQASQLQRSRKIIDTRQGVLTSFNKHQLISFSHNDYLGLSQHPKVKAAACEAIAAYGTGSNASPLVAGHTRLHQQLEETLAERLQLPKALLFSSGTLANHALMRGLGKMQQAFFPDKQCHASILDGLAQQKNKVRRFPHNNSDFLEKYLLNHSISKQNFTATIITEGVFSMSGNMGDLPNLSQHSMTYNAPLIVDDSHGIGVLGINGAGTPAHLKSKVHMITGSLGKALASHGGFIAGPDSLIDDLIQSARPLIYSTAMAPASAAAALTSLHLLQDEPQHQASLHANIAHFQAQSRRLGLEILQSQTAIQGLAIPNIMRLKKIHESLITKGFLLGMMRPPTVQANNSLLRICLSALHTRNQIDSLLSTLSELLESTP